MKSNAVLLFLLAIVAVASGVLMSDASWIGRVGITLFYKEYNLLKIWWQGAIAVYIFFLLLFMAHTLLQRAFKAGVAKLLHFLILIIAVGLFYFTYDDFHTDLSHRLLKWRFHLGFYLVWGGWMLICLFFILRKSTQKDPQPEAKGVQQV